MCGLVKVVVKIESEEDLLVLQEKAKSLNIPTHVTIDAGRTQIAPSESPSSSASDVDNLNNQAMVDKVALSKSIGAHAGNHAIVAHNRPNFVRLLDFTKDVNSAMDASKKSQDTFVAEAISQRLITHHGYKLTVQLFSV